MPLTSPSAPAGLLKRLPARRVNNAEAGVRGGGGSPRSPTRRRASRHAGTYGVVVDTAIYTLNILRPEGMEDIVARLRDRLADEGGPNIFIDQRPAALRFTADTWRPTLVELVNDAIDAELGVEERQRRFKAF